MNNNQISASPRLFEIAERIHDVLGKNTTLLYEIEGHISNIKRMPQTGSIPTSDLEPNNNLKVKPECFFDEIMEIVNIMMHQQNRLVDINNRLTEII